MARPHELQTGVRADLRLHAVHLVRQARAGKDAVELHEHLVAVADALAERGRLGRQCGQNAFDLLFLADQQLAQGVVRIDIGSMKNVLPVEDTSWTRPGISLLYSLLTGTT